MRIGHSGTGGETNAPGNPVDFETRDDRDHRPDERTEQSTRTAKPDSNQERASTSRRSRFWFPTFNRTDGGEGPTAGTLTA